LFCPSCDSPNLRRSPHGTKAVDYTCPRCDSPFQLKSASTPFRSRIVDAAYSAMRRAIVERRTPNLLALQYDPTAWVVRNLVLIPQFVFSLSCLEKRAPLGPRARRAGWVGCTIVLTSIPPDARIPIISNGASVGPSAVRMQYARLRRLAGSDVEARGWTLDVLNIVRRLQESRRGTANDSKGTPWRAPTEFTLADVYAFAGELARLHPQNKNVEPKIRQQLQILRDMGFVGFLGRGKYQA
jgi:type II restriction enzyme